MATVQPDYVELTPEESEALLDARARHYLDMSGAEFRRRYRAGELDSDDAAVMRVAMLLPPGA